MALPGYCIGDLVEDAGFLAANERAMQRDCRRPRAASRRSSASSTVDATARNESGTIRKYNAAAVVRDGRVLQRAHKTLLPNYRYFDDKRFFAPGDRREPVDVTAARRLGATGRVDLRGHVGRVLRRQAAALSWRQGRRASC